MKTARVFALVLLLASFGSYSALSQSNVATGTYPYGTFVGGPDTVNLGNLNVNWQFPIINKAGRGLNFVYGLAYDSSIWYPATSGSTKVWTPVSQWGWSGLQQNIGTTYYWYSSTLSSTGQCAIGPSNPYGPPPMGTYYIYSVATLYYVDEHGVSHPFPGFNGVYIVDNNTTQYGCPAPGYGGPTTPATISASDGSGLLATYYQGANRTVVVTITAKGTTIVPTDGPGLMNGSTTYSSTDRNGNEITGNNGVYTDTLGQTALTVVSTNPTNAPPTVTMGYVNASGGTEYYTVNYGSYKVQTNFQCSPTVTEYPPTNQYLVSNIETPDGRYYYFTYEPTPGASQNTTGRIASVKLPTGGTISYSYSGGANDGINCVDGSTTYVKRTTPDGQWTYARTGSGNKWTTVTTTPTQDQTASAFLTTASGTPTYFYETDRKVYTGSQSSGTLMETVLTCYESSANQSKCSTTTGDTGASVALPLSQVQHINQYPDSSGIASGSLDQIDGSGNLQSQAVYDYGHNGGGYGNLLQTTGTGYNYYQALNFEVPTSVTVTDGAGTKLSQTTYVYDNNSSSPTVTPTSGTPQHVAISGSRANLTSVSRWVAGSTTQTTSYTYFDTGNVQTQTDVNSSNVTTNTYGNCGNSFLTHTSTPVKSPAGTVTATLTTSAAWNCVGGVQTSTTDYNNNITTYNYGSDPYWRPVSSTDAGTNTVSYTYPDSSSPNTSSVSSTFNGGSSIIDVVTTTDGLGRAKVQQRRQGPSASNYDSIAISYDSHGRKACQTAVPYSDSSGAYIAPTSSNAVCTTYDALDRPVLSTDAGGGNAAYTYTPNSSLLANYTLVTLGPAPTNENTKRRLLGYNGAGQLTSVCEVTSLSGSGSCGANTGQTGYLTQYTYDGGNLMKTQQNVQAVPSDTQTRTINAYDGLGRILSETIPEWSAGNGVPGTTTYVYDTDSTCGSTSTGDLIKKTDNAGNVICNTYDSLHRLLTSTVKSGTYASNTPTSNFVYDAASYSGTAMQNAKGNLAEAYTGSSASKITDLYFSSSYSTSGATLGGVVAQVWEKTPHSTGYFLTTDTSYPNGALGARSTSWGAPSVSYGLDAEGRPNTATDTTHTINLVTSASYNTAGSATGVMYGNGDSDAFTYDPATNQPLTLVSSITGSNPYSMTTTLTWNANASLAQMQITDTLDSSKNQTCNYSADDLRRIASVDCLNTWAQNFTYSAFGNINKANAGNATSYQAAYNDITNQVKGGPAYDANGNQLSSTGLQTIGWNAAGNAVTITPLSGATVTGTYDALNRLVETSSTSGYAEFVYGASGDKAGRVNGSAFHDATVALPGGEHAVYNAGGFDFFAHTDWLGSARLSTLWAHGVYSKESYAPFGEIYNESGANIDRNFTGHDQSEVTGPTASGTYESWFRKYDPAAGRWLSPDPLGWGAVALSDPASFDRYAYVMNRPMSFIDPNGLDCWYLDANGSTLGPPTPGDCPTDANGNPTDDGIWVPDGATPYFDSANSDLIDSCIGSTCYNADGATINPNAPNDPGDFNILGLAWGGSLIPYLPPSVQFVYGYFNTSGSGFSRLGTDIKDCFVNEGLPAIKDDLNPFSTSTDSTAAVSQTLTPALSVGSRYLYNKALTHAASRGLTTPLRSSIYRGLMEKSGTWAEAGEAPLTLFDKALWMGVIAEAKGCL